jgi:C4-type Zn-finger protein
MKASINACAQCGADVIAPEWSGYLSDRCVRNIWSCEACGYQFEDTVCFSARTPRARRGRMKAVGASHQIWQLMSLPFS